MPQSALLMRWLSVERRLKGLDGGVWGVERGRPLYRLLSALIYHFVAGNDLPIAFGCADLLQVPLHGVNAIPKVVFFRRLEIASTSSPQRLKDHLLRSSCQPYPRSTAASSEEGGTILLFCA